MPLTDGDQQALLKMIVETRGCPLTVADRLQAFAEGIKTAIITVAGMVSVDPPPPAQPQEGGDE